MPDSPSAESLSVADVVMTILEARRTMPWATAASVLREKRGDIVRVVVVLLESAASPSGAQPARHSGQHEVVAIFNVRRLGDDLATAFGQKDLLILK